MFENVQMSYTRIPLIFDTLPLKIPLKFPILLIRKSLQTLRLFN